MLLNSKKTLIFVSGISYELQPTNLSTVGNEVYMEGARIVGNQIIYNPMTNVEKIVISGYRYHNYPINRLSNLFSWREW
jgi:microcompartment protein CcmL/EutN